MRAIVAPAIGAPLEVREDHPDPTVADGEELIEVTACGVCHSDLHVVDGDFPSPLPMVLGHEVTGVHHELGPVMVYAPWGCRSCRECGLGREAMCASAKEAGLFTDGGYAERMRVPHRRYLFPLDGLDPITSAPLACGGLTAYRAVTHTLDTLRAAPAGGRALVVGAGGLGQFAIRYLRLLSDAEVVALDTSPAKQATAVEIGAHAGVGPDGVDPASFDAVLDFIGAESTLTAAMGAVLKGGIVAVVGLAGGRIPFGFGAVPHEVRLMSSVWGSLAELDDLLALARREPDLLPAVETLPLAEAQTAHERLRAGDVRGRFVLLPDRPAR